MEVRREGGHSLLQETRHNRMLWLLVFVAAVFANRSYALVATHEKILMPVGTAMTTVAIVK